MSPLAEFHHFSQISCRWVGYSRLETENRLSGLSLENVEDDISMKFSYVFAFYLCCFVFMICGNFHSDDVFIATYPKCGTTWTQEITYLINNDAVPPKDHLDRLQNNPFIEITGEDGPRNMRRPGCIKTHLPRNLVPYADHAKYIYVLRNPKGKETTEQKISYTKLLRKPLLSHIVNHYWS